MRCLIWALAALMLHAAVANARNPATTQSTDPRVLAAEQKVAARRAAADAARSKALQQAEQSPEFKALAMEFALAKAKVEQASASGTPQQQRDAAAAMTSARARVDRKRAAIIAADPVVKDADDQLAAAQAEHARAKADADSASPRGRMDPAGSTDQPASRTGRTPRQ